MMRSLIVLITKYNYNDKIEDEMTGAYSTMGQKEELI
jgi:hypothetical protein